MHEKNVHMRVKRIAELRKQMKLKGTAIHDDIEQQLQECATPEFHPLQHSGDSEAAAIVPSSGRDAKRARKA
eukprot:3866020-Lingulodinium_polyedra.AAC.1